MSTRILGGLMVSLLLAACGGGSGGGSSGGGAGSGGSSGGSGTITPPPQPEGPTTTGNGVTVTVDKTELRLLSFDGRPGASTDISFSVASALAGGKYFALVEPDGKAVLDTYVTDQSLTSIRLAIRTSSTASSVDGTITFKLCGDEKCASLLWSRVLPYQLRNYRIDTSEARITGYQGAVESVSRAITPRPDPADFRIRTIGSWGDKAEWLSARVDDGALLISGNGSGLAQNSYSGSVIVENKNGAALAQIPVAMAVGAGIALPADRTIALGARDAAVQSGTIDLRFQGTQSPAWSAASDKPWLTLARSSGTGAASIAYSVDASKLGAVANFAPESAAVTFKVAGQSDAVHRVTVTKSLPEILAVTPNVIPAGTPTEVRLRGRGLSQLASIGAIRLGGVALTTGSILSDTEAVVTMPALGADVHEFTIPVSSGIAVDHTALMVGKLGGAPAAVIPTTGTTGLVVHDPVRSALYVVDVSNRQLRRYQVAAGSWTLNKSVPVESSTRIALSLDGRTLFSTMAPATLEERDPFTLAVKATHTHTGDDTYFSYFHTFHGTEIAQTNDGRLWFQRGQWSNVVYFDSRSKSFGRLPIENHSSLYDPDYVAAADGSRMFIVPGSNDQSAADRRYNPATGVSEPVGNGLIAGVSTVMSGDGKYLLNGATRLYEAATLKLIGQLPGDSFYREMMLSPKGDRIYGVTTSYATGTSVVTHLDVYDTLTLDKVGQIAVPKGVIDCPSNSYDCSTIGRFSLGPLGDTIFWIGNKGIGVIPIPAALRPNAAPARFKLLR